MATLNQFQKYSQTENAVTNNILLMLSSLYEINPKYYENFIKGITEDSEKFEVIPVFRQQVGNRGNGIIDGYIHSKSSKIIIETKINNIEGIEKLVKYSDSFDQGDHNLLIHLSSQNYSQNETENIQKILDQKNCGKVNFFSLTYQDLVDQLKEIASNYQYEHHLQKLSENFESYCMEMNLTSQVHIMRAMACGQSYELNKKHEFYFDVASRGYRNFKYLGIYKWKAVRHIGLVENMIEADWDKNLGLKVKNSTHPITEVQKIRLIAAIRESSDAGWAVKSDHRFFLLSDFCDTDFKKTSPGGIFRVRFFNLEDELGKVPDDIADIASQLKTKSWK